jgi:protein-S-isoprenylcysteine O-methyltransferase Ste14
MTTYQRIFAAAPLGLALSLVLFLTAYWLAPLVGTQPIHANRAFGNIILVLSGALAFALSMWTHATLPPLSRGKSVVTAGPFKYVRHPNYASFLLFFFGLALWLDHWLFLAWAILEVVIWHLAALYEERFMRGDFPQAYDEYCRHTKRFIPGLW